MSDRFPNPYTPGAGHFPPYLAGRETEIKRCGVKLDQTTILQNIILTGLRGVGKTVLLAAVQPIAIQKGWLWCGTDMSESACISEEALATRILTDLAPVTSAIPLKRIEAAKGFSPGNVKDWRLNYNELIKFFNDSPGLVADKLKATLEGVWRILSQQTKYRGIVFAYDEVQLMQDHAKQRQYPLSILLDVFQSLQRKGVPYLLILTGLPTLQPKLVATRTYTERMFEVIFLEELSEKECKKAIEIPIQKTQCPVSFTPQSVELVIKFSGGYPYFIQFMCKEVFDIFIQQHQASIAPTVPMGDIMRKLDQYFFAGRWANLSDRQRDLLQVIVHLNKAGKEFAIHEIEEKSREVLKKPFSSSHITQILSTLSDKGIIYKGRYGRYLFAVPLLDEFIKRQMSV